MKVSILKHIGTKRHSGRYPWGSGKDPYQHDSSIRGNVREAKKRGYSEQETAIAMGYKSTGELRKAMSHESALERDLLYKSIEKMSARNMTPYEIASKLGVTKAKVVYFQNVVVKRKEDTYTQVADTIKGCFDTQRYLDIGKGTAGLLGIQKSKFDQAIKKLENEGYVIHKIKIPNVSNYSQPDINLKVLAPPGTTWNDIVKNKNLIEPPTVRFTDLGDTHVKIKKPDSISGDRVFIRYGDKGGEAMDGVIQLRRGAEGLDLGQASYAQVRIAVDNKHYMKGMALYSDDIPKGYDVVYNTNKKTGTNPADVYKPLKENASNPFGSTISRQSGHLNIIHDEGHWSGWGQQFSSQFLAKQNIPFIKERLNETIAVKKAGLDSILTIENPSIRKKALIDYSDKLDKTAIDLEAIRPESSRPQILLPLTNIKNTEIYAPNFNNGDVVSLVRHPHAGTFEIPTLTVNNRNKDGRKNIGSALDAVGIHADVAKQLSGADFDGDTVLVIKNNNNSVKSRPPIKALQSFEPKLEYPPTDDSRRMAKKNVGREMGMVSNLITDMQIMGSGKPGFEADLVRAVKHSMVVIDAEKHKLNYKLAEKDLDIAGLKKKYQTGGASTLMSRARSPEYINERRIVGIDRDTGEYLYRDTGRTKKDRNGDFKTVKVETARLNTVKDAHELSSGTRVEGLYADFSNTLRQMARDARRISVNTEPTPYSAHTAKLYADAVDSINKKIQSVEKKLPLERFAQNLAQFEYAATKSDVSTDLKKYRASVLQDMRVKVGGKSPRITLNEREVEALNSGALSPTRTDTVLRYASPETIYSSVIKKQSKVNKVSVANSYKSLIASGYTNAEIAGRFGISVSYLLDIIK